jgi:hypothetical protein
MAATTRTNSDSSAHLPEGTANRVLEKLFPTPSPYATDPTAWIEDKLGWVWSKQADIADSVCDNRHTAVPACHGPGKSWIAGALCGWWIDTHPLGDAFVVTTAPTQPQIEAILWREIGRMHRKCSLPGYITIGNQPMWKLPGGEIVGFGRKPADYIDIEQAKAAFQGIHARYVLIIIDEAAGIPKWLWDAVESLITNENARILAIGNPDDPASQFAKICAPNSGWNTIQIDAFDTPNFTSEKVPPYLSELLTSPTWVEERRTRWGEGTPLWESRVRGRFPSKSTDVLIQQDWVDRAKLFTYHPLPTDMEQYGVDVARAGQDASVITHRAGLRYRIVFSETGIGDTMKLASQVRSLLALRGSSQAYLIPVFVDLIGVGAGVYDRLNEQGFNIGGFNSSQRPFDTKRFANRRAEQYWHLRTLFRDNLIDIDPEDEELATQLVSMKWKVNPSGKIQVESKEDMKKRGMPSPDRADSIMMASVDEPAWPEDAFGGNSANLNGAESLTGDLMGKEW